MNSLDWFQSIASEFGFKIRFIYHDGALIDACACRLRMEQRYSIYNMIIMMSKYGIIEVLDILDEVVDSIMA